MYTKVNTVIDLSRLILEKRKFDRAVNEAPESVKKSKTVTCMKVCVTGLVVVCACIGIYQLVK